MKFRIVFPDLSGIKKRIDELLNRGESKAVLENASELKDKVMGFRPSYHFDGITGIIGALIVFFVVLMVVSSLFSSVNLNGTSNSLVNVSIVVIIVPIVLLLAIFSIITRIMG